MRDRRSWRVGLAMGVMLVSGGCATDAVLPHPADAPRVTSVGEAPALKGPTLTVTLVTRFTAWECRARMVPLSQPPTIVDGKVLAPDPVGSIAPTASGPPSP